MKDVLPGRAESVGRTVSGNRLFVNDVLWVLRSRAHWYDRPERHGKYKSLHKRFRRWAASGIWEKTFRKLLHDRKKQ